MSEPLQGRVVNNILPAITESGVLSVVDHLALPAWREKDDPDHKLWQDTILGLSEIDNVFIKLSGIDMFRRETEFDEVVKFCLKNVPIGRLIYGSNYPVSFTHDYNYWFDYLNNLGLSATEKEQIFFKNAFIYFQIKFLHFFEINIKCSKFLQKTNNLQLYMLEIENLAFDLLCSRFLQQIIAMYQGFECVADRAHAASRARRRPANCQRAEGAKKLR